ncbi:MAG: PRC-barrel domain-containing protein [Candidatus Thorarchaeota archaeon]|nr:PRC-barrel domain-containing protein [Candidatus Thorarchaeota archaeon]
MKFSDIKNKDVTDASGEKVGRVIDFIVRFTDNKIDLKSVVLGGGRIEELLESLGIRPDKDPIFQLDCIDSISDIVHLKVDVDTLKTTLDPTAMETGDVKMSELAKLKVVDSDGFKVGKVMDVWFDDNAKAWLVIGGGFVEETLENLGVKPDIDLLIPADFISEIQEKEVYLKWTRFQLGATCEECYTRYKRELESQAEPGDSRFTMMKLISHPSRGRT